MNKRKKLLLLIALVVLTLLTTLFLVSRGRQRGAVSEPTVMTSPIPAPRFYSHLVIQNVSPDPNRGTISDTSPVVIVFDKPVLLSSIRVTSVPTQKLRVVSYATSPNAVLILPEESWIVGQKYVLGISAGVMSADGSSRIDNNVVLNYRVIEAELPKYNRPP